jgi:hypothetical protein
MLLLLLPLLLLPQQGAPKPSKQHATTGAVRGGWA